MKTNKKAVEILKELLLDSIGDNREEAVKELARYKKHFACILDYNVYAYGNILPYYSQIREFFEKQGVEYPSDTEKLDRMFKVYVREAVDSILTK